MDARKAGARPKQRGAKGVRFEKKTREQSASDTNQSFLKGVEHVASPKRPMGQKSKTSAETTCVLHSTLLDSNGSGRPDLEFSAIKDKTGLGTSRSNETKQALFPASGEDLIELLDSQALLLSYASIKIEKNLAHLQEEAERNLLTLSEEAEKLQREVHRKKRLLHCQKWESKLGEAVDRQLEALSPIAEQCDQFRDHYKHFATALDSTRHELPLKEIYMGEDRGHYLADLQKDLAATQKALSEALQEHSARNAKALSIAKELEEASLKVDAELPRTLAHVLDLSADVSKEAALCSQDTCEDTLGLETMRQLYFS